MTCKWHALALRANLSQMLQGLWGSFSPGAGILLIHPLDPAFPLHLDSHLAQPQQQAAKKMMKTMMKCQLGLKKFANYLWVLRGNCDYFLLALPLKRGSGFLAPGPHLKSSILQMEWDLMWYSS